MKGMRYESVDVTDVNRYIADEAWVMEQKVDGIRCIVHVTAEGDVQLSTHTGERLKSHGRYHGPLTAAFKSVGQTGITVDGELLEDGSLWLFDIMEVLGTDTRLLPQGQRRALLDQLQPAFGGTVVSVLPQAITPETKAALWQRVLDESLEGVVVKRKAATYSTAKGRTKDVLKVKVTRTIDVVVSARNLDGHENAELSLWDGQQLVKVGRCSMIGKHPAQPGDVIEVQFLYILDADDPTLVQARMMRPRPDRSPASCEIDQLDGCVVSKQVLVSA